MVLPRNLRSLVSTAALAAFLSAGAGGCMLDPIAQHDGPRAPTSAITHASNWKIVGSTLSDSRNAIDGDLLSAATSTHPHTGAQLTIDLGKPCLFNQVIIDHGPNEYGFARKVTVLTSRDGREFTPQYVAPGTRRATYASLVTCVLARYVRLQVVQQGDEPWSVAEVYFR
jgi:hypothetical protein